MALSTNSVWEVRAAGNDTNGGGFVSGAAGTDYSQQNSKNTVGSDISTTDGVGNGTTTFTSATANFGTTIVGNIIYLQGGTGALAAGWYQVTARASTTSITLDRAVAAGTGITVNIGGALASPGMLGGVIMSTGNRVWIQAGTYTVTSATPNISGGCLAPGSLILWIEGYQTVRGDLGTKPIIKADGVITTFVLLTISTNLTRVRNLEFDGNNRTSSRGITGGAGTYYRIVGRNFTNSAFVGATNTSMFIECLATGCSTVAAFVNCMAYSCIATANTFTGFSSGNLFSLSFCISSNNTGATTDGFTTSATTPGSFNNCVAYGNGRDGFRMANSLSSAINCVAENNGGFGFNSTGTTNQLVNCAGYNNTSGNTTFGAGVFSTSFNFITGTVSFFTNAAAGDFSPAAGSTLRTAGIPGPFPDGLTTGYLDIGIQHIDPAGGGSSESGMAF